MSLADGAYDFSLCQAGTPMFEIARTAVDLAGNMINETLEGYSHAQVLAMLGAAYLTYRTGNKLSRLYHERYSIHPKRDAINLAALTMLKTPIAGNWLQGKIDAEIKKTLASFKKEIQRDRQDMSMLKQLLDNATPPEDLLHEFYALNQHHTHHKLSGAVYIDPPTELLDLLAEIFKLTAYTNPLHAHWPFLMAMEAQVISWSQNLFGGKTGNPGIITHGGTSSILEAINIYVQHKRAEGVVTPEIVVPDTAHAAFIKGARITGAKLIIVPTDKKTGKVDPKLLKSFVNQKTAMIVGSAPSFMNGICDDIEALGQIALEKNVPLHVDGCLGGWISAFDDRPDAPKLDFRIPGVNSISADTHKYGYAPKGSSILLFSDKYKPSTDLEWPGGLYVTKNHLDGSRSGFQIAALYATLKFFGLDFYRQATKEILNLSQQIKEAVNKIDGVYVRGAPKHMVVGIASDTLDIHVICDQMKARGWSLSRLQNPDGFHLCVTKVHTEYPGFLDEFIADLKASVLYTRQHPEVKSQGEAKAYGKLKEGIPPFVQDQIGVGYAHLLNTVGLVDDEVELPIREVIKAPDNTAVVLDVEKKGQTTNKKDTLTQA